MGAYALLSAAYLAWRATSTLNPHALAYAWAFWAFEAYGILTAVVFFATVADRARRPAPPPLPGLSVDVLVCTYNEALGLVRETLRRAVAMDYPHRTWLCDDGDRPAARALAAELGCGYLARGRNTDFKAGNLNHALAHTRGDLVVVLDADHIVRPELLSRLVGYFRDPKVAVVQIPQVFYNLDSFQHHLRPRARRLWHEGAIFHHAMQPGADRWNASTFVGTGAVLRRAALERIGGFATGSVTEDAFTSMRLHADGWRSVYHDEPLGYLLAPDSLVQYLTQRLRWAQGAMQILRRESPLWKRGLSPAQRLVYFSAFTSFGQAVLHLVYYLAPAVFLLGGPAPVRADRPLAAALVLGHVAFEIAAFKLFLGPLARPLLAECYKFLNLWVYLRAVAGYFLPARPRFQVTNKGRDQGGSLRPLGLQIGIVLLEAAAVGVAVLRLAGGRGAHQALGVGVSAFFAGAFAIAGGTATLFGIERMVARADPTFADEIPATLLLGRASAPAVVARASASELHVVIPGRGPELPLSCRVALALDVERGAPPVEVYGRVTAIRAARAPAGLWDGAAVVARVALEPLGPGAASRLLDRLAVGAPRIVDPLIAEWRRPSRRPSASGPCYLALESTVL